jgi:hypothetical protein
MFDQLGLLRAVAGQWRGAVNGRRLQRRAHARGQHVLKAVLSRATGRRPMDDARAVLSGPGSERIPPAVRRCRADRGSVAGDWAKGWRRQVGPAKAGLRW